VRQPTESIDKNDYPTMLRSRSAPTEQIVSRGRRRRKPVVEWSIV
jgi:hypothetical protein